MSNLYFDGSRISPQKLIVFTLIVFTCIIQSYVSDAQNNQVVQVKAFSENLNIYPNLSLSINKGEFISLNENGAVFANLKSSDIPIQSIKLKDETLEVASWNLSKGILEVIIRKKNYIDKEIKIVNENGVGISNIQVQFTGKKKISKRTNREGILSIPLALNEEIKSINQFKIPGYDIKDFKNQDSVLIRVQKIQSEVEEDTQPIEKQSNQIVQKNETGLILQQLDTITSLRVFYKLLNKIQRDKLSKSSQAST
ncbi:hypothetical protein ABWH96_11675 [Marivirga tractuosa]|uniref:hypothetical protein n=1 Tax=Marivirga tractuosa TaxID=1006 RepID=UPI0035CFB5AC